MLGPPDHRVLLREFLGGLAARRYWQSQVLTRYTTTFSFREKLWIGGPLPSSSASNRRTIRVQLLAEGDPDQTTSLDSAGILLECPRMAGKTPSGLRRPRPCRAQTRTGREPAGGRHGGSSWLIDEPPQRGFGSSKYQPPVGRFILIAPQVEVRFACRGVTILDKKGAIEPDQVACP